MEYSEIIALLEEQKDERGIAHFKKLGIAGKTSFGLGIGKLRKVAKQVGKNPSMAAQLRESDIYDANMLMPLILNPKTLVLSDIESLMEHPEDWQYGNLLSEVFAKTKIAKELIDSWHTHEKWTFRRCAYGILYQFAKSDKKQSDDYYLVYLDKIEKNIHNEENLVKDTMNNCLLTIGKRNKKLYQRSLEVAKAIGKVEVDYGANSCEALDCIKHLSSPRLAEKFA